MHRSLATVLTVIVLILAAVEPPPVAVGSGRIQADLDGQAIEVPEIANYHCHDLDFPIIHCFGTEGALDAAILIHGPLDPLGPEPLPSSYVELFDATGYSGASIYLSSDYTNLGLLGWNDRASSYVGQNSLRSGLYVNTTYGGDGLSVCCNQGAASLSSTFDNKISSARQT